MKGIYEIELKTPNGSKLFKLDYTADAPVWEQLEDAKPAGGAPAGGPGGPGGPGGGPPAGGPGGGPGGPGGGPAGGPPAGGPGGGPGGPGGAPAGGPPAGGPGGPGGPGGAPAGGPPAGGPPAGGEKEEPKNEIRDFKATADCLTFVANAGPNVTTWTICKTADGFGGKADLGEKGELEIVVKKL